MTGQGLRSGTAVPAARRDGAGAARGHTFVSARRLCGLVLVLLGVVGLLPAEELPVDEALLRLAAETDGLREDHRRLIDAWRDEEARLLLVEQALADELARLESQVDARQQQLTAAEQSVATLRQQTEEEAAMRSRADALAARIETQLDRLRQDSLLAIHQIGAAEGAPATTVAERLATAFEELARAERQSRALVRRRLGGRGADGRRHAAEVLALGGAGAWWLDAGGSAGPVRVEAGRVVFEPATDAADREAVAEAFAVQAGTVASAPVALPVATSEGVR